ncbi:MAG: hypothetical protein HQ515_14850 [Phycisphaeraceae bacterium]|nr:hypothetical protein [Phycisphaeraceae bacterium]
MPFCTVITCMDGRIQKPMMEFLAENYGYDSPDTITDAGPVKALSEAESDEYFHRICRCIDISVHNHDSKHIFIAGHHGCVGNPAPRTRQEDQLRIVANRIRVKYPACQVDIVYINEQWQCDLLD